MLKVDLSYRLFRFDLCRVSFLTTLDIYKDYFKGRVHALCDLMQKVA